MAIPARKAMTRVSR
jgi:hypothetical protein